MSLSSQERIITILLCLEKNHAFGLTNKELTDLIGTTPVNICRDLAVLEKYDLVSKNNAGRNRLSVRFGQIANSIMKSYQVARLHLSEDEANYASAMQ
ncbi:MAG: hypothetical protein ACRC5H_02430 [Treponemataceae bacterium]